MSRSPVSLAQQTREGERFAKLRRVAPRKVVRVRDALVPVSELRGVLDAIACDTAHKVGETPAPIPTAAKVLVVSRCGIAVVTRVATKRARTTPEPNGSVHDTCAVEVVCSWLPRSVLRVGSECITVPCAGVTRLSAASPMSVGWAPLEDAHTPYYSFEALAVEVAPTHRALSSLCCAHIGDWFAVVRLSYDGFECLRCPRTFPTLDAWAKHYTEVDVPTGLMWKELQMSDRIIGAINFSTLGALSPHLSGRSLSAARSSPPPLSPQDARCGPARWRIVPGYRHRARCGAVRFAGNCWSDSL